jgi:hypothetical protein
MKKELFFMLFSTLGYLSQGQIVRSEPHPGGQDQSKIRVQNRKITDTSSGITFVLDSVQIYIEAKDKSGKLLWRSDPWKDNNLSKYRTSRPIIINFTMAKNKKSHYKSAIFISYDNTQFGWLEEESGKFTYLGQD